MNPELDQKRRDSLLFLSNLAHNHGGYTIRILYSLTYPCKEDRIQAIQEGVCTLSSSSKGFDLFAEPGHPGET